MNCIFDKEKECPLGGKITLENMGRFCQACIGRDEMHKALESLKVMRAQIILALLAMFPKDEEKAKLEYQKLMKRVEEW